MKRNWLPVLSVLSLLGFLGYFTGNSSFYGFFGFLGWLSFLSVKKDERLIENINKACRNAFFISLVLFIGFLTYGILIESVESVKILATGFAVNFVVIIVVFTLSFHIYDKA
ncbi:DUF3796 domain-containing protein [Sporosalibacterium faouarense]|uniref:DUF3796 domain-containing protein n=1 Tax=Sporosalibacterium faouarense TaxID=516123 RepID=UPI00192ADEBF|nr:DUF3796 domain-containing protein [Sporosalibacterium faouarense]